MAQFTRNADCSSSPSHFFFRLLHILSVWYDRFVIAEGVFLTEKNPPKQIPKTFLKYPSSEDSVYKLKHRFLLHICSTSKEACKEVLSFFTHISYGIWLFSNFSVVKIWGIEC